MSKVDQTTLKMLSDVVATMAQMVEAMATTQNEEKQEKAVLKIGELAVYIGRKEKWIRDHRDILPPVISKKPLVWIKKDIDEWLETQRIEKEKNTKINAKIDSPTFGKVSMKGA